MRTQKEIIRQRLIKNMPVCTVGAVTGKYGRPIYRLASLINKLKKEFVERGIIIDKDHNKDRTVNYFLVYKEGV